MHNSKRRIYWADDDFDDLSLFQGVLQELAPEYELLQFENGKLLLDRLQADAPDNFPALIVLDINMPVMDGKKTLVQLKNTDRLCKIPVVVFTTSSSNVDKHFFTWMHTEMLTKPFTYDALKEILKKMLSYASS